MPTTKLSYSNNIIMNNINYDHVVWNGIPISFVVPVGKERILKFPSSVTLENTNVKLTRDKVSILNNAGFLYISAKKKFANIRISVVIKTTGKVVLIDLSAKAHGSVTPVKIMLPSIESKTTQKHKSQLINYVTLMRYAIQHLYSPQRLIKENNDITRTAMYTTSSVNLFNNSNVIAMPLLSWRGGDLYITAVFLKNVWQERIVLDPRNINGHWLATSFYPTNFVDTQDSNHDRTIMFVISDQPFNSALQQMRGYL